MCFAKSAMWANPLKTAIFTVLSSCFWSWWKMLIWLALECSTNGRRKQGLRLEPMRYMFSTLKTIPTKRTKSSTTRSPCPPHQLATAPSQSPCAPSSCVVGGVPWLSRVSVPVRSPVSLPRALAMSAAGWCARVSRVRCAAVCAAAVLGDSRNEKNVGKVVMHFFSFLHFYCFRILQIDNIGF